MVFRHRAPGGDRLGGSGAQAGAVMAAAESSGAHGERGRADLAATLGMQADVVAI